MESWNKIEGEGSFAISVDHESISVDRALIASDIALPYSIYLVSSGTGAGIGIYDGSLALGVMVGMSDSGYYADFIRNGIAAERHTLSSLPVSISVSDGCIQLDGFPPFYGNSAGKVCLFADGEAEFRKEIDSVEYNSWNPDDGIVLEWWGRAEGISDEQ